MRGKGGMSNCKTKGVGITPAYAGKSLCQPDTPTSAEDHPRVCGEKLLMRLLGTMRGGSPPRMRGKAQPLSSIQMAMGITPAYAGKRRWNTRRRWPRRDHPRVCGEKPALVGSCVPPRWITPAYAGKRCGDLACEMKMKDHPRVCGEKRGLLNRCKPEQGSPPRMRGKAP